jgi:hypothetical protein
MKKFALMLAVFATLAGNSAFAQSTGRGAATARTTASDDLAWGIGLGGLAVLGVVVGLTAAAASHTPSTFSH